MIGILCFIAIELLFLIMMTAVWSIDYKDRLHQIEEALHSIDAGRDKW